MPGRCRSSSARARSNRVHDALQPLLNSTAAASLEDVKREATTRLNPVQRLARTLSDIFVPIIPVIVASGLLMGVLGMLRSMGWAEGSNALFQIFDIFASTAFVFLPILIAFSAGKSFGVSPFLAAALAGILIHPALQNAWTLGSGVREYWDCSACRWPRSATRAPCCRSCSRCGSWRASSGSCAASCRPGST